MPKPLFWAMLILIPAAFIASVAAVVIKMSVVQNDGDVAKTEPEEQQPTLVAKVKSVTAVDAVTPFPDVGRLKSGQLYVGSYSGMGGRLVVVSSSQQGNSIVLEMELPFVESQWPANLNPTLVVGEKSLNGRLLAVEIPQNAGWHVKHLVSSPRLMFPPGTDDLSNPEFYKARFSPQTVTAMLRSFQARSKGLSTGNSMRVQRTASDISEFASGSLNVVFEKFGFGKIYTSGKGTRTTKYGFLEFDSLFLADRKRYDIKASTVAIQIPSPVSANGGMKVSGSVRSQKAKEAKKSKISGSLLVTGESGLNVRVDFTEGKVTWTPTAAKGWYSPNDSVVSNPQEDKSLRVRLLFSRPRAGSKATLKLEGFVDTAVEIP